MQARFRPHLGLGWGPASWDLGGCRSSGLEGSRVSSHQVVPIFGQSQGWPAPGTAPGRRCCPGMPGPRGRATLPGDSPYETALCGGVEQVGWGWDDLKV